MNFEGLIRPSLETANRISDWANIILISSLIVGALATAILYWASGVKEGYWDQSRETAQTEIDHLKAPRTLTQAQFVKLVAALTPFKEHFSVSINAQDQESLGLAEQLVQAAVAAGWTFQQTVWPDALAVSGIEVQEIVGASEKNKAAAAALISTLKEFGLQVQGPRVRTDIGNPTFFTYLIVGRKP